MQFDDETPAPPLPCELSYDPLPDLIRDINNLLRPFEAVVHVGTLDGLTQQATCRTVETLALLADFPSATGATQVDAVSDLLDALDTRASRAEALAALQAAHPHGVTVAAPDADDVRRAEVA